MIRFSPPALLKSVAFSALILFIEQGSAAAANNPLNTVRAVAFYAKSAGVKTEPCSEGGENLCSIHNGDYIAYKAFDFDSGVAAFKIRLGTPRHGKLEIRLDRPAGPLMGSCEFKNTGGWQAWQDVVCNLDNSQSGVRDIYLVFSGETSGALTNVSRFVFLKSVVVPGQRLDLSSRLDVEDNEPQATASWGIPETGFNDDFSHGLENWKANGFTAGDNANGCGHCAVATGSAPCFAYTPNVYINKTDTGGEWRTMAQAALSAEIFLNSQATRAGLGFASKDGKQLVYVAMNVSDNSLEAHRRLLDGTDVVIARHPKAATDSKAANYPPEQWTLKTGVKYRLQVDWSPYSNALIAFLKDDTGAKITSFRTVIDLPAARRPLLISSGGEARFEALKFDPALDNWNYKWEWRKTPVLSKDVCNPAVWKGKDGKLYMMWRKFGADNYHGVASSSDGIQWTRVNDEVVKCTGDMNIVLDPFGNGLDYITGGGGKMDWWTTDGAGHYSAWQKSGLKVGDIFGNCRIQEIIDTKRYPQMNPVRLSGTDYRFIAYTEDWNHMPKPHTVVLLSNTLTNWVLADPNPVLPPMDTFWGEKGSAIGSAMALPDGNILISSCSCTFDGYTGASEPSNITAIADGKCPWKLLKLATLPDAPVSREGVWYQGPNFGTAFYYDKATDTLFFYGGFHDYEIGMMRVRNFLHSKSSGHAGAPSASN